MNGLKPQHQQQLIDIIKQYDSITAVWLFGSRAMNNYTPYSDIDLALEGETLSITEQAKILTDIDQTNIPYKVDLVLLNKLKNTDLIEHITQNGIRWM